MHRAGRRRPFSDTLHRRRRAAGFEAGVGGVTRVLIVTANIGAGHDLPAELLAAGLREREPAAHVVVADGLAEASRGARALTRDGMETILERAPWLYDAEYWLV